MSKDIDPTDVRVLKALPVCLVFGPLRCFHVGQEVELPEHGHVTVRKIDLDGAGLAVTDQQAASLPADWPPANFRTCYPSEWATDKAHAGMLAQQERNRREHGVELPAEQLPHAA